MKIKKKIKFSFNIFELISNSFFCSCLKENLKLKTELNLKANALLNFRFDIVYIQKYDFIRYNGKILWDKEKKNILNGLSRPILYRKKKFERKNDIFYNNYF